MAVIETEVGKTTAIAVVVVIEIEAGKTKRRQAEHFGKVRCYLDSGGIGSCCCRWISCRCNFAGYVSVCTFDANVFEECGHVDTSHSMLTVCSEAQRLRASWVATVGSC